MRKGNRAKISSSVPRGHTLARPVLTMEEFLKHRLTTSMAVIGLVIIAGTITAGHAYPVALGIIWAVYAATLAFAAVSIRTDMHHG